MIKVIGIFILFFAKKKLFLHQWPLVIPRIVNLPLANKISEIEFGGTIVRVSIK